ncbi:MAG: intermembrane transport protein PqiB [Deltaproteobacteria bacterium]|nr:intermembrane transport protein PqiB [Deltaproteobacteria bacterium]MBW2396201.1 intermembrane transport protein PqiB [Deltaproteobacteria bacterium]
MADEQASVSRRRGISTIWVVPIVALLLGGWTVFYTWSNQGPEITLVFDTAEGIEAGKTRIKARSVEVGMVTEVGLADDFERVVVTAEIEPAAERLLRDDTQFWVVRPRVGAGGISGLGTIVSGGYIELAPGEGPEGRLSFVGLEDPPVTPVGTPGLKFELVSEDSFLGAGDAILYRGYNVGRVESATFDVEGQRVHYDAFIEAPYDALVRENTRFWNASGVRFSATADGIEVSAASLESLVLGGVSFGVPEGRSAGGVVEDGTSFNLFAGEKEANERPYHHSIQYVVQFERSVRGLRPGAPVEYRGIPAGHVERIMMEELVADSGGTGKGAAIPVLISLEPGRIHFGDDEAGTERLRRGIELGVPHGMRATLQSGNLLTGSLLVALDEYSDAEPAELGEFQGYPTIPTISSGLEGLQHQVSALLAKLNALPLESIVASTDDAVQSANDAVKEMERAVASVGALLQSENVQGLPESLEATLAELDRTLRQFSELAASLEAEPSSLIFSRDPRLDPEPAVRAP